MPEPILPGGSPPSDGVAVAHTLERSEADTWAMVLASQGIASVVYPVAAFWVVAVEWQTADAARSSLEAYSTENAHTEPPPSVPAPPTSMRRSGALALATGISLLAAYLALHSTGLQLTAVDRGAAGGAAMARGEVWRAVTALTLHGDLGHALANTLAGAFFFAFVYQALGPGVGVFSILSSAAVANIASALAQGPLHRSIGASTAVFAALGILTGRAWARRRLTGATPWALTAPLLAGAALLGLFGTSPHTDALAHLAGFASGTLAGALYCAGDAPAGPRLQALAATAAATAVAVAWWLAL